MLRFTDLLSVLLKENKSFHRCFSSKDIRNIGILAHIDAGKTTTTERMLFYAGKTRSLGEVHRGNTVTDYLSQERERGITICSSAVTFGWLGKRINLLDTPGHIDFTMEVEQSLHAVDGVIVVLDGTAGVEAQTITVWTQAERHCLPKLIFINKMDRPDAKFSLCVDDVEHKLGMRAVCLQYPEQHDCCKGITSILDVITLKRYTWKPETLGQMYKAELVEDDQVLAKLRERRNELIDRLSGCDDELANFIIAKEGFEQVDNQLLHRALQRATCEQKIVPILLGSAYKNMGVQCLMDAVVNYLPAPHQRNHQYDCFGNDFVGKVFKIVHDKQRGPLTLVRIYRGELKRGMRLISAYGGATEVVGKLYEPLADEYREIDHVQAGNVALCAGLKNTTTGDLLTVSANALRNAQKRLQKQILLHKANDEFSVTNSLTVVPESLESSLMKEMFAAKPLVPDAVYFCSIEPPSLTSQTAMETALRQLQREDPSLRVSHDAVTGQTVLGGMGELHMDIIRSRILSEYKIDVDLGPLQIAYKETIEKPTISTLNMEKDIAGTKQSVLITLELIKDENDLFSLSKLAENVGNLNTIRPRILQVIRKGAVSALERGPRVGGEVVNTQIRLHNIIIGRGTADSFIMATAAQCVHKILSMTGTRLLEPIMALQIIAPADRIAKIIMDLSRRRAVIQEVLQRGDTNKIIVGNAPLSELVGYSSTLRTISSGTASITMQPNGFANMNPNDEIIAMQRVQGLV